LLYFVQWVFNRTILPLTRGLSGVFVRFSCAASSVKPILFDDRLQDIAGRSPHSLSLGILGGILVTVSAMFWVQVLLTSKCWRVLNGAQDITQVRLDNQWHTAATTGNGNNLFSTSCFFIGGYFFVRVYLASYRCCFVDSKVLWTRNWFMLPVILRF
jgi:hypothetical protein